MMDIGLKSRGYVSLLRPHQYVKNFLIFMPLFFGGMITDTELLASSALAFLAFCLVSSAVYAFNDIIDRDSDRQHPDKKDRPIASGTISTTEAYAAAVIVLVPGLVVAALLGVSLLTLAGIYIALNLAYTLKVKHYAILDVFIISICYVIRLYAGSAVTDIQLSMWIILMTFLLALFIALGKRRNDMSLYLQGGEKVRKSLDGYNMEFLTSSMVVMAAVLIVSYIMYTASPDVVARAEGKTVYMTVVFVILGILRFLQMAFVQQKTGSPTLLLLTDRFLQLTVVGWLVSFGIIIYR